MIYTIIMVIITLIAILMTIVILLQSGQGQGLSGGIAGGGGGMGGASHMMGARRTADFLSKSTSVLAAIFLSLCLIANYFIDRDQQGAESIIQEQAQQSPQETDFVTPTEDSPAALPEGEEQDAGGTQEGGMPQQEQPPVDPENP